MIARATSVLETNAPTKQQAIVATRRSLRSQHAVSPMDHVLLVQRTLGNRAVGRFLNANVLQTQLEMGVPGDVYEQEADRVADAVMRMPAADASADEDDASDIGFAPSRRSSSTSDGQPLPAATRAFFERRLSYDFGNVRVHADAEASAAATAINARAFTVGQDIVFGAREYAPETVAGRRLLAHELVHVIQQSGHTAGADHPHQTAVVQRLRRPGLQGKWRLDRVTPDDQVEIAFTRGHASTFSVALGSSRDTTGLATGSAKTWQETGFIHQKEGGEAQIAHWMTKHYIFKNDGADNDFLQIRTVGEVVGNAKAEDLRYARATAVVWGRVTERTAANPTPPSKPMFDLEKGGVSAATVGDLGEIEIDIPIGEDGSAKITLKLTKVDEGEFAPFSGSQHSVHDSPATVGEVDVMLGARISAEGDIQTAFTGLAPWISRNWNTARAAANFDLIFESRPAPGAAGAGTGASEGTGAGGGGDIGALARKWGCEDVRCNVYPVRKGATCPDRVIGNAAYIYSSYDDACTAAQKDANSQVPEGCNKRHCNCKTKCKQK